MKWIWVHCYQFRPHSQAVCAREALEQSQRSTVQNMEESHEQHTETLTVGSYLYIARESREPLGS